MQGFISINIFSLLIVIFISIIFFYKKRLHQVEDNIYSLFLIADILVSISGIFLGFVVVPRFNVSRFVILLLNKIYLLFIVFWDMLLAYYTIYISYIKRVNKDYNNYRRNSLFILMVVSLLLLVLPVHIFIGNDKVIAKGPAIYFSYFMMIALGVIDLISIGFDYKNIKSKKYIPLYALLLLGTFAVVVQIFYPELNYLINPCTVFITLIMFHTIENPDVKMIEKLELAKDVADKANSAKTDFLSNMSHEIRTPLNAIVGFSECIEEAEDLDEAKENAKDIISASETLLEIVNGILDISKIEAGKLEIVNSSYNANELFLELTKLIAPKMKDKNLEFTYNIAPDLPNTLYGDHANLKKIITNLLSNACKYTSKGYVHFEVSCINSKGICKLIISVEDSGRGIKKENIDKLFTKFERLDEDRNTTIEGTGLGLAITKQLIELMGGRIIVHTIYGEGSKFTVVLNQKIETSNVNTVFKEDNLDINLHGVKILLVDDNEMNLKVTNKLLQRFGANEIVSITNGFECIERIEKGEYYDIILLDDMMPKMSGVETLQKLKNIPNFNIPVVALTANAITGMKEKYINEGFTAYLSKPLVKEELIKVFRQLLKNEKKEESKEGEEIPKEKFKIETAVDAKIESEGDTKEDTKKEVEAETEVLEENETEEKVVDSATEEIKQITNDIVEPPEISDEEYLRNKGVDLDKALELLGDMEMYNATMDDFLKEVEGKWMDIEKYKLEGDMENYQILVHSLKSDCKYLGFMRLADLAYQHELSSKANDKDFVNKNFNLLEEEFNNVLNIVKDYLDRKNKTL